MRPGNKGSPAEGGTRVPFIVHWPDALRASPGSACSRLVSQLDLFATFDEMLRGSPRWSGEREDWSQTGLDSLSFLPYLTDVERCDDSDVAATRTVLVSVANGDGSEGAGRPQDLVWSARLDRWSMSANVADADFRPATSEPALFGLSGDWFGEITDEQNDELEMLRRSSPLFSKTTFNAELLSDAKAMAKQHKDVVDHIHDILRLNAHAITSGQRAAEMMNDRASAAHLSSFKGHGLDARDGLR